MLSLVLASQSPRRQDLLAEVVGVPFEVKPLDIDETPLTSEKPRDYVMRIVREKAHGAFNKNPTKLSIVADTIVAKGNCILRKAKTRDEAFAQIQSLSGRRHHVLTALACTLPCKQHKRACISTLSIKLCQATVKVKNLSEKEIKGFVESDQWRNVAVYRIQNLFGSFVSWMQGHPSIILGLPLFETRQMLLNHASYMLRENAP